MTKENNVIYGPVGTASISETTAGKQLYDALQRHSHLPQAMINFHTKETVSYTELFETSCKLAHSLQKHGYKQNDVISICSENNLQFFYPVLAALYSGFVVTLLNNNYNEGEFSNPLNISKPKLIFCSKKTLSKIMQIKPQFTCIKQLILLDAMENVGETECLSNFMLRNCDSNFDAKDYRPLDFNSKEQVATILSSSGTTGLPKGVMITHKNLSMNLTNGKNYAAGIQNIPGTSVLSILPYFHSLGFLSALRQFINGLRIVMLSRFEPESFLKSIVEYEVCSASVVSPVLVFLARSSLVEKYDLSSLNEIICAGAPLGKETIEAVTRRLHLKGIRQGYGTTETTGAVFMTSPDDFKIGSSGKVVPFISVKIQDTESGRALTSNKTGEICVRGVSIMKGYLGNEKATKEIIDENGWLHTGDLGYYDENCHFYIVDRVKHLIKYKGFQVSPAELEALLLRHPCVKDAAVVGIPDQLAGELPAAFIVKQPGIVITETEILDYVSSNVSTPKRLRGGVHFTGEIPKNATGKILRNVLRELFVNIKSKL